MNGPEHYAEAERLIALAEQTDWTTPEEPYRGPAIAAAQVHATLALVAASVADRGIGPQESTGWHAFHTADAWREVTS